jgi:hypothetical protein
LPFAFYLLPFTLLPFFSICENQSLVAALCKTGFCKSAVNTRLFLFFSNGAGIALSFGGVKTISPASAQCKASFRSARFILSSKAKLQKRGQFYENDGFRKNRRSF